MIDKSDSTNAFMHRVTLAQEAPAMLDTLRALVSVGARVAERSPDAALFAEMWDAVTAARAVIARAELWEA